MARPINGQLPQLSTMEVVEPSFVSMDELIDSEAKSFDLVLNSAVLHGAAMREQGIRTLVPLFRPVHCYERKNLEGWR